ncbi:MAG: YceI family protein [Pseudomonadota bacterium]|nr:YceI family protein [Pseudomonadota bacterium]
MATWNFDPSHSTIGFSVRHMVISKVRGRFTKWSGSLVVEGNQPAAASVEIEVASIDTAEPQRDAHLRSPDFFDAEQFPTITFQSTRVEQGGARLVGNLTIHGVTHEIALEVEGGGRGKDPWGNDRIAFEGSTSVNRKDFGLGWNQVLEAGGVLVGEKIDIHVEIEAIRAN